MLRLIAPALVACLLAGPALATQEYILPTLFDVTNVASDDVLNVRAEPDGSAAIIGTLAPDAKGVEVIEEAVGWGRVNTGEGSGWVSMRYLNYRTDVWEPGALPADFRCLGTEPFWDLKVEGENLVLSDPDQPVSQPLEAVLDTGIFRDPTRAILGGTLTVLATPEICSDGMSDRLFGLRATVIHRGEGEAWMLNGCCLIEPGD
ncbi:SH3 domain-containing protein [Paracoccus caeni]|uniref:SH3 domain-containing protein n=1 Tax=Paracoccus caeni TaxID=657651 RepID=A0A934SM69_9RHOB|nr:SH3 domain-containing protein [Paracoccus caeni]MBK4217624.1 SH3 domain-containing protein [Paracoccus caeni]